jgi:hypothetical protein
VFVFPVGERRLVKDPAGDVFNGVSGVADATLESLFGVPADRFFDREAQPAAARDAAAALLSRAAREIWRAHLDGTDEALLSANRAIECLRRTYDPDWDNRKKAMKQLTADLKPNTGRIGVLAKAAEAVRHGDRPVTTAAKHPINTARAQRGTLLDESRRLVREAFLKRPYLQGIDR